MLRSHRGGTDGYVEREVREQGAAYGSQCESAVESSVNVTERVSGARRIADDDLASEIELYGEMVVAASESDGPLTLPEIDELLGIAPEQ